MNLKRASANLMTLMQVNVNLAGLPALVVPCGFVEGGSAGLPVGLQMIGSPFSEVIHIPIVDPECYRVVPGSPQFPSCSLYLLRETY